MPYFCFDYYSVNINLADLSEYNIFRRGKYAIVYFMCFGVYYSLLKLYYSVYYKESTSTHKTSKAISFIAEDIILRPDKFTGTAVRDTD